MWMSWLRLMNWLGWRKDKIACMRQEETWRWPAHLGERTEGDCVTCGSKIFYEKQNAPFQKVCNHCAFQNNFSSTA